MSRFRVLTAALATLFLALAGFALTSARAPAAHAATCTVTSPPDNACGPYSDPNVFTSSNGVDYVVQNDFSSIPQTLTAQGDNNWTVAASTVGQQDQTSVKSYPATQVTYTLPSNQPDPSSDFGTSLISQYANVVPTGANQDYEYAVDDWLADPTKASWTGDTEIMIWTDVNRQVPFGSPTGQSYVDPSGQSWQVWTGGGATTVSPVSTISFVRGSIANPANSDTGTIERMGFYKYLQNQGLLASTYGIDQLNYGLEICSTGGATRTYGVSNYTIVPNGQAQSAPVVSTNAASGVSQTVATLNGAVNPEGQATTYHFEYGTTTSYGTSVPVPDGSAGSGSTSVNESANLTGLTAGTTYHFRIVATNATGTSQGNDQQFTTSALAQAPVVVTNAASGVSSSGATLNGTVNPNGQATTWQYQYGTTTSYGSVAPATAGSAGSGTTAVSEPQAITGLAASTTYHYRLTGTNATGTTNGTDQQFTTSAAGSTVAYGTTGPSSSGAKKANTLTLSWTQSISGSNPAVLAETAVGTSNNGDINCGLGITDNGVAMTKLSVVHNNNQDSGYFDVFGLDAPPAGTNTFVATVTSGCSGGVPLELTGGSMSFTGAVQTACTTTACPAFSAPVTAFGAFTQPTATIASSTGNMVAGFVSNGSSITSATSPSTSRYIANQSNDSGAGNSAGATSPATGSNVTMKWAATSDWWGEALFQVQHA